MAESSLIFSVRGSISLGFMNLFIPCLIIINPVSVLPKIDGSLFLSTATACNYVLKLQIYLFVEGNSV